MASVVTWNMSEVVWVDVPGPVALTVTSTTNCTRPALWSNVAWALSSTHCSVNFAPPDAVSDAEDIIAPKDTVEVALRNCPGVKAGSKTALKLPRSVVVPGLPKAAREIGMVPRRWSHNWDLL